MITALNWTVENRHRYNLKVVNLSLGHPVFESYVDDPLCQAVQQATDAGLLCRHRSRQLRQDTGRPSGPRRHHLAGEFSRRPTVGAVNARGTVPRSDDLMATYSSRGPTLFDGLLKPELVAPGNRIVAAAAPGAALPAAFPDRVIGGEKGDYMEMSGTSMSAAVVSGAAALLLDANPRLSPAEVKLVLQLTRPGGWRTPV